GFEEQRKRRIIGYFSTFCDSVSTDVIGNVMGTVGRGDKTIMLAGHYDQIGFMVSYVEDDGYVCFKPVGGWDPRVIYGARVKVWTGPQQTSFVTGTIGAQPAHLVEREEREKAVKMEDMRIDVGASSKVEAEKLGVLPGCVATIDSPIARLGSGESDLVVGAGFDDSCSIAAFLKCLESLEAERLRKAKVCVVATVQEEIGLRGAMVSGFNIAPWCAIAVDVTHAISPGVKATKVGEIKLGGGPAIGVGPNFTKELWTLMVEKAKERKIPFQVEPVPGASGTDAWALQVVRGGRISGLISVPNRYMHSANEVVSINDLENVGKLLAAM
ncbi:MAG: M20/M25/M40 family metallo-hydrolase, partial [Candidatus Brockarchaeota archaeon]|nr:M20/M25/M40 family metallo-hydrolase [Candidatus Brockarchaeota archaeon]